MPDLFLDLLDDDETRARETRVLSEEEALVALKGSQITGTGLIPWGSNYSFAVALELPDGPTHLGIYKPRAGEAPLHDFPSGTLYKREIASFVLCQWIGWRLVPPTIEADGPHGIGSLQIYIEPAREIEDPESLWGVQTIANERMVLFDHLTNNADRKLAHCLLDANGDAWGIDHGLTFNEVPKLRTVMWQFNGEPISQTLAPDLQRIVTGFDDLRQQLGPWLHPREIEALALRAEELVATGHYPVLNPYRNIPYGWW